MIESDRDDGWNQNILIPIKQKEILVYNGLPHHYEMIGFILDFCNKNDIIATIVNKFIDNSWLELYEQKYKFNSLSVLPVDNQLNYYLFILLLTDHDMSFSENLINDNVVCIDHYYLNRRPSIKYHLPITPFNDNIINYTMPIFEYIDYDSKINILSKNNRPIITFLGNSTLHETISNYSIITNLNDFDVYIINRYIPRTADYLNLPNIHVFENISAIELSKYLLASNYICHIPNKTRNAINQCNNYALSACVHLSFSFGCKLIIPNEMNKYLKLLSPKTYNKNQSFSLDINPPIIDTFEERTKLITIRDNSLMSLKHMQLYNKCIK